MNKHYKGEIVKIDNMPFKLIQSLDFDGVQEFWEVESLINKKHYFKWI